MLVSSIGYFNVQKTVVHNSVIKDKTANKSSLNEGFGYSTAKKQNNDTSFMKTFIDVVCRNCFKLYSIYDIFIIW
jgi:hypothetical protein